MGGPSNGENGSRENSRGIDRTDKRNPLIGTIALRKHANNFDSLSYEAFLQYRNEKSRVVVPPGGVSRWKLLLVRRKRAEERENHAGNLK